MAVHQTATVNDFQRQQELQAQPLNVLSLGVALQRAERQRDHFIRKLASEDFGEINNIRGINEVQQCVETIAKIIAALPED